MKAKDDDHDEKTHGASDGSSDGHDDERDEQGPERLEVRRGRLPQATQRDPFAPLAAAEAAPEDVHARQAAVGEHRKYAGPVFEEVLEPAALSFESDEEDVEATEVAAAPDDEESDEHEQ